MSDEEARQRAIDLLESQHEFPGEFSVSAIAIVDEAITAAILTAAAAISTEPREPLGHEMVPSSRSKYVSHRLRIHCRSAAEALELFARLRAVEGVLTVM